MNASSVIMVLVRFHVGGKKKKKKKRPSIGFTPPHPKMANITA